ncbi:hypothetical protein CYFUS_009098 [Cystobacter fuscus]|uniref:Uncharacterized protein n=1 Tax=Cystobacter fuscus TaxID=43 RepID=A0A250JJ19_9BACT|nr:hypothetical protein [Cystobacter fuscus]ATB43618.1 hypothetical protein CYFUS_009098 [Cystobacter fuscus]
MQPNDLYDEKTNANVDKIKLKEPTQTQGSASKEFVTRLAAYRQHLSSVNLQSGPALEGVVEGLLDSKDPQKDEEKIAAHRLRLKRELGPLVEEILTLEKRWLSNVCKAHESAEKHLADNQKVFTHLETLSKTFPPAQHTIDRLKEQRTLIKETWKPSRAKWTNLDRLETKIKKGVALQDQAVKLKAEIKKLCGNDYFEGLRRYLRGAGFIVAPSYIPPAAVFPRGDWISLESNEFKTPEELACAADALMMKYQVLGTSYSGMRYKSDVASDISGCVCISWVIAKCATNNKRVLVPVMGMSGGSPNGKEERFVDAMLGACALPPYRAYKYTSTIPTAEEKPEVQRFGENPFDQTRNPSSKDVEFNQYYDDIMVRANNLAINYRVRELLSLRLPSRQAMLSYLGLSFATMTNRDVEQTGSLAEPTPGVTRWHSFNCAEPAALAWISSFFVDGQDVHLCCPYEGADDPGALGLKPKETCPWCATVELTYRSLKKVSDSEQKRWPSTFDESMRTGKWAREFTGAREFKKQKTDLEQRVDLPRNKRTFASAYPSSVNDNVALLREIFKEVGLLKKSTIREEQLALWQQKR